MFVERWCVSVAQPWEWNILFSCFLLECVHAKHSHSHKHSWVAKIHSQIMHYSFLLLKFSYCQHIQWKDQNQQRVSPRRTTFPTLSSNPTAPHWRHKSLKLDHKYVAFVFKGSGIWGLFALFSCTFLHCSLTCRQKRIGLLLHIDSCLPNVNKKY